MRLATFRTGGNPTYGVVSDAGIFDLGARLGARFPDLRSLLAEGGLAEARLASQRGGVDAKLDEITFDPVIPNPGKVFCIGHNYEEHRIETKREKSAYPTVFLRTAESLTGHDRPLVCPRESKDFDYEGEIAIVIGMPGRRIQESEAWRHIAGYSCFNDGSVRDCGDHLARRNTKVSGL